MKRLLVYLKEYRKETILSPFFKLLEASFELMVPLVIARIINLGIRENRPEVIIKSGFILATLGIIGLICAISAQYFAAKAACGFAASVRSVLYSSIQRMSYEQIDQNTTSTLITRMTGDVARVQTGVNLTLRLLLRSPFIVFGSLIMAFVVDNTMAVIFVVVIPLLFIVVFTVMLGGIPLYKKVQHSLDRVLQKIRENLNGVRVIRAFNREETEEKEFFHDTAQLKNFQLLAGRFGAAMNPMTYVIINAAVLVIIYMGSKRVESNLVTQGEVVALLNYMAQILVELIKLANLIITIVRAMASADRITQVLEQTDVNSKTIEIKNGSSTDKISENESIQNIDSIKVSNISYHYPDAVKPVINNISLEIKKGQILGVIGGTGCGKSTLVHVLSGFLQASEGEIFINEKSISSYDSNSLRKSFGIVPQRAVLFRGTVRENLLWGQEDASDEEMITALKKAQAYDFIMKKDQQLDCEVTQEGRNFSGGQRQRLTLARAIVRNPEVLILDDSTSALDYLTEAELKKTILHDRSNRITIVISQRTGAVQMADKILVLEDGEAVGLGTHEELLNNAVYREIYQSQFTQEKEVLHA